MVEILRRVSPDHLRILHADYPHLWVPLVFDRPVLLPNLMELYHSGRTSSRYFSDMYLAFAVERLRISGAHIGVRPAGEKLEELDAMLNRNCPLITHLRFNPGLQPPSSCDKLRFIYAYCDLSRPLKDISESYPPPEIDGYHFGLLPNNYPPINVQDFRIPSRLRRVIVENPPELIKPHPDPFRMVEPFILTRIALHYGYRAVALEAKEKNGMDEEALSGKRSLRVLPLSAVSPMEDSKQLAEEEFFRYKADWLERTTGTGPGCWA